MLIGNPRQFYQLSTLRTSQGMAQRLAVATDGIGSASNSISSAIRRLRKETVVEMQRQGKKFRKAWWKRIFPSKEKYALPPSKKASLFPPTFINVVSPLLESYHRRLILMSIMPRPLNLYIGPVECFRLVITISIDFRTNGSGEGNKRSYCIF